MIVRNVRKIDEMEFGIFVVGERPLLMRIGPRSHPRHRAQVPVPEWV